MPPQIPSTPPGDKTGPPAILSAERSAVILQMKREGKSFATIGAHLGISRQRAHEIHRETLRNIPAADVQDYRATELERLEYLREQVQQVIERRHYLAHQGKITEIEDDGPLLAAVAADIRISESIRKLVGADAPVKVDATVNAVARYEVVGVNLDRI